MRQLTFRSSQLTSRSSQPKTHSTQFTELSPFVSKSFMVRNCNNGIPMRTIHSIDSNILHAVKQWMWHQLQNDSITRPVSQSATLESSPPPSGRVSASELASSIPGNGIRTMMNFQLSSGHSENHRRANPLSLVQRQMH